MENVEIKKEQLPIHDEIDDLMAMDYNIDIEYSIKVEHEENEDADDDEAYYLKEDESKDELEMELPPVSLSMGTLSDKGILSLTSQATLNLNPQGGSVRNLAFFIYDVERKKELLNAQNIPIDMELLQSFLLLHNIKIDPQSESTSSKNLNANSIPNSRKRKLSCSTQIQSSSPQYIFPDKDSTQDLISSGENKKSRNFVSQMEKIRSMEEIGRVALQILDCLAYLQSDKICVQFLAKLLLPLKGIPEKVDFERALELLQSHFLLTIKDGHVEPLEGSLQTFLSSQTEKDKTTFTILAQGALTLAQEEYLKWDQVQQLFTVWSNVSNDDEMTLRFKSLPVHLANRLEDLGMFSQLITFSKDTLLRFKSKSFLPEMDPDVLKMEASLGYATYLNDGRTTESLDLLEGTYLKMRLHLGEKDKATLNTATDLAGCLEELKRYDEAQGLYENVLEAEGSLSGGVEEDKKIYTTKFNLAGVYVKKGQGSKGMEIYEQVLVWEKSNLGENHPSTLDTKHEIAGYLFDHQENFKGAEEMYKEILRGREEVLGSYHPATIMTRHNLGMTLCKLAQVEKGLEILKGNLPLEIKYLGENNPIPGETKDWIECYSNRECNHCKQGCQPLKRRRRRRAKPKVRRKR